MNIYIKLFCFLTFLSNTPCRSQNIDTGQIEYEISMPRTNGKLFENSVLVFNDSISIFTYRKVGLNELENSISKSDEGNVAIKTKKEDEFGSVIYRNFNTREIIFRKVTSKFYNAKLVEDNWVSFDWRIKDEFKKINNYNCQKAIGKFRGRKYTAWFSEELPLKYGPWKLYGLPGLILEAFDEKKEFTAKVKKIVVPMKFENDALIKPNNGEKLTIKEFAEFQKNIPNLMMNKIKTKMPRGMKFTFKKPKTNFIELKFEWEEEIKED
jgi:GLPGLI family protein